MKRWGIILAVLLLAGSLSAKVFYDAPERQMPQHIYNAFFTLASAKAQLKTGQALSSQTQQQVSQARQTLKGLIVVEVGFSSCKPCFMLLRKLVLPFEGKEAMVDRWQREGVQFYQLNSMKDIQKKEGNLTRLWNISSVPVLFLFKDGELMQHDFGSGLIQSRFDGFTLDQSASVLNMLEKWTEYATK